MKLWGGRFKKSTDKLVEEFTTSLLFDKRLYREDIAGSIAHVKALARAGIIESKEADALIAGLSEIYRQIESGKFSFDVGDEDIHMAIERALIDKLGPLGGKLHTARSRNDQVALDLRLYLKQSITSLIKSIMAFQNVLIEKAEKHLDVIMPGYTHLQVAQPILFAHHLMAYFFMLLRDLDRLKDCYRRTDVLVLGSAALAGTSFKIDRQFLAKELGFSTVGRNSMDAVSDRDFVVEFLAASSLVATHLSRLAEEIVIWSSQEFSFIELDDAFSTGSSIMPQKKNPDVAELVRGKSGRIFGNLIAMLVVLKGLPLAYNRDLQEDKEALFDTFDNLQLSLETMKGLISTMKIKAQNMFLAADGNFIAATDYADYLVGRGVPFRAAHEIVGEIVKYCNQENKQLSHLSLEELRNFSQLFEEDALKLADTRTVVERRLSFGGTASKSVKRQLREAKLILNKEQKWLAEA
jgi:argininosuccinate lyase